MSPMGNANQKEKLEKPKCLNHPEQEAIYRCDNCGKPYCERCVKEKGYDRVFCAD
jgi:hypothetical protein